MPGVVFTIIYIYTYTFRYIPNIVITFSCLPDFHERIVHQMNGISFAVVAGLAFARKTYTMLGTNTAHCKRDEHNIPK